MNHQDDYYFYMAKVFVEFKLKPKNCIIYSNTTQAIKLAAHSNLRILHLTFDWALKQCFLIKKKF